MIAEEGKEVFVVVVNHEEQYSIWPEYKTVPAGWRQVGEARSKELCLEHIKSVWTDMRPLSLRQAMEAQAQSVGTPTD
jgi:MbtH protein